ncbi:SpaA isopeptide-forming pilin-related protein [Faecalibaculum rodentium]|jgi:LPXTG-motif cell wall-anchored protein|uniref:SpaA isopeptide-forming pilin-related protein n=2 Tax=Faecalibaculum rodentium TaxID=1702221 RepID=UPI0025B0D60B|nr:SpaA isopeptide-forming pilin-related protein [Faecalibaculum rodentium]
MNKLRNKFKTGVMSLMVAAGAVLPSVTPIMAQDDPDPKLTVTVEGSGTVQISEKDSEKFQFALPNSPFEELIKAGTTVGLECTGDGQVVKELTVDDKVQSLDYGKSTLDFDFVMPEKDADIRVVFEAAVNQKEKTTQTAESKPVESESNQQEVNSDGAILESVNLSKTRQYQLTDEEQIVIDQYKSGDYQSGFSLRKKIAEEYRLTAYVDKDYFLTENFFQDFGFHSLSWGGTLILSPYEKLDFEPQIYSSVRSTGTVTKMDVHTWNYGGGGFMNGAMWTISVPTHGSQMAFCANGMQSPPPAGTTLDSPVKQTNENLRKALYYGYGGPQNKLTGYNTAQQVIFTNDLVSVANTGTCMSGEIGGGWIWNQHVSSIWNQLQSWPSPPANYVVYLANSRGNGLNWQGITTPYQPLAYGVYEEQKGYLGIVKGSSNQTISNGNDCYDLTKAEYTLYSDAACTKAVRIFKLTNVGGGGKVYDGPYEFPFGTYYLKETKAATGYALDPTVHTVKVEATGQTHPAGFPNWKDFEVKNIPQSDPVGVLLQKVDADTGQSVPQGGASLKDAQFTFKFYAGYNPNMDGAATRTWVMKTDNKGQVRLQDSYKVSGDAFYTNSQGNPTLPLGTLTIQETKAPAGYYLNSQLYTVKITSKGQAETVQTYNAPTVKEQVNDLLLTKVQLGSNVAIPGTVFTWTKPDGKIEDVKTDGNGQIKMTGLATGVHKLKEKSVMDGYTLNPNEFSFEVTATGITAKTDTSGKNMTFTAGTTTGKSYQLTVEDGLENYDLKLIKVNEHDKLLPGAEFTLYSDAACTKVVAKKTTDASGILIFDEIKDRTDYWFKETKAPEGYRIPVDSNGNQHVYKLRAEATPAKGQFDFYVDGTKYTASNTSGDVHLEDVNGDKVVSITVINYTTGKLPETGSNGTLLLLGAGLAAVAAYFALNKKRKTN